MNIPHKAVPCAVEDAVEPMLLLSPRELHHGGRLQQAATEYAIPVHRWLDLSTGINPNGWEVTIPDQGAMWQRLPEEADGLEQAACAFYGATATLPVAGSQAAIMTLPRLRAACRVGVFSPAYAEHAHSWESEGHELVVVTPETIDKLLPTLDVMLVVNPNNPTATQYSRETLLAWHRVLTERNGWLIVDEAFADVDDTQSLVADAGNLSGLIVLRSLGKFFGLAGVRVGFVFANRAIMTALRGRLGPWAISGPARYVAREALKDLDWHRETRVRLNGLSQQLAALLQQAGLTPTGSHGLFHWIKHPHAPLWHRQLAEQGILTRLFDEPASLRFGLPRDRDELARLRVALTHLSST